MRRKTMKEFTRPEIERVTETILGLDWKNSRVYGDFLAQTYYHIRHSTRLLAAAAARFTPEQETLHLQCLKHAGEEKSHEKLSSSDLEAVGHALGEFPELPATKALYRSQYYLIEHENPLSLFGYAYFLEWIAVEAGSKVIGMAESFYGPKAVKHMHVHTREDPAHIAVYEKQLDEFTGPDRAALEESVRTTAADYERIYREIEARAAAPVAEARKLRLVG